ncbi:cupredoxin domain-containing protein [Arthrobacter sp. 2MCAF15]|uniref:cupredoxin domain-containing protein n=1 Tax=Arthrobacter sp. 2MCAF15 TaxID=3232984 RepID=UPI003F936DC4
MNTAKNRHRLALLLISAATIAGASACAAPGTGAATSTGPSPATTGTATMDAGMSHSSMGSASTAAALTIHIKSFAYAGPDSVPAGASVTVMNMDTEAHTLTADDGSFEAVVKAGTSVTFTAPAKPGSYPYHCAYHANMHGTLTVK